MSFKHECDPNFDSLNFQTWFAGDLVKFKCNRAEYLPQHIFTVLKVNSLTGTVRILVRSLNHGITVHHSELVHVARPIG